MPRSHLIQVLLVFVVAVIIVAVGWRLVGEDAFARQVVVWIANVAMLATIWLLLRARGEKWPHIGLRSGAPTRRAVVRAAWQSILVLVFALAGFVLGSVVGANVAAGAPAADMSGYDYLRGNLPMLLAALAAVYVVSSFGEEVVYRGFLMTRLAEMGGGTKAARATAVVVSAVIFGLAHFSWGLMGIIQTTFMGAALSISYLLVRRNLWVLVLAHACMDTALLVQVYLGRTGATG